MEMIGGMRNAGSKRDRSRAAGPIYSFFQVIRAVSVPGCTADTEDGVPSSSASFASA